MLNYKSAILLTICLSVFAVLNAQTIKIGNIVKTSVTVEINSKSQISAKEGLLYILLNDSAKVFDSQSLNVVKSFRVRKPADVDLGDFEMLIDESKIYFVDNYGGGVYQLLVDTLIQKDNSIRHNMQIGSNIFFNNGVIYRYGGYGFWSVRNLLTYFDFATGDWEVVQPSGSKVLPTGNFHGQFVQHGHLWYFFGGKTISSFEPEKPKEKSEFWEFNHKSKEWRKLGTFPKHTLPIINAVQYRDKAFIASDLNLFVLDIPANKMKIYKNNIISTDVERVHYFNEHFYIIEVGSDYREVILHKIHEDDMLSEYVENKWIYKSESGKIALVIVSVAILFIVLFISYLFLRKRGRNIKVNFTGNTLQLKNRTLDITDEMSSILSSLLKSDELQTEELLDTIKHNGLHKTQRLRILNNAIDGLNFKLFLLVGEKEVVKVVKSKNDKRIKVYKVDKSFFLPNGLTRRSTI